MTPACASATTTAPSLAVCERLTADATAAGAQAAGNSGCRIGVDVVEVHDVAESIRRFGDRYLNRVFTEHERACCAGDPLVLAAGLAARFAAKEAAIKILRPSGAQPDWRAMEVVRRPSGACDLVLHDRAAELAAEAGLHSPALSLSHEGSLAVAVVIALTGPFRQYPDQQHPERLQPSGPDNQPTLCIHRKAT